MPSNWLYVDTNFPSFTGKEPASDKIDTIQNYLYVLLENLRYCLRNLDASNMNQTALQNYENSLTEPIYGRIEDSEGNINQLQITAQGLAADIRDANGNITQLSVRADGLAARLGSAEGNITQLSVRADGLSAQISNAQGDITQLQATAQGLVTRVGNTEGAVSALQQTVNGFTLSASNGESSSTLGLYSNGVLLSSANIQLTGMVTFNDLSYSGRTTINGDNITTGKILSDYIKLRGKLTVYNGYSPGGYLGYMSGLTGDGFSTPGIGIQGLYGGQCLATTEGARLTYGSNSIYTYYNGSVVKAGNVYLTVSNSGNITVSNTFRPTSSGSCYLGTSSYPWAGVYASTGEILTSDRNRKHDIEPLPDKYLDMLDRIEPKRFKMNDGASGRFHVGFIAQEVEEAMAAAGVDPLEFGGWVKDTDEEGNDIYMLRYDEFIGLMWGETRRLKRRVEELEGLT